MDAITLARLQFGVTTVYHFFFVPLTLGLSVLVAIMETLYVRTGQDIYKQMTKFWGKLFIINFAMGVVTGIVQEFQFGMNWSEYSRFVGDIFGAPLAIEALSAFFLESIFLGVWIFGWDKLSRGMHALTIWLVAIASNLSALWILVANSFMQEPVGYVLRNGRAEMTDFFALVFNPNVWVQFPHTVAAGFATGSIFVMGISAYHLARKNHMEHFKRSFKIASVFGTIAILLVIFNGHSQTQHLIKIQPMKFAAAEALWYTESPASFSLLTIGDWQQTRDVFSIRLPRLLCLLAYNRLDCQVQGVNDLQAQYEQTFGPGNYIPPVAVIYWSFRIMVGAGFAMAALLFLGLMIYKRGMLEKWPRILPVYVWAIALPYLANTAGWLLTEIGRFPWVVYGVMKIEEGISTIVPAGSVLATLIFYTLIYGALMVAEVYLLLKFAKAGPAESISQVEAAGEQDPSLLGDVA